jgi:ABC-type glycerol-3-phosphate transport system substrate-binding protein
MLTVRRARAQRVTTGIIAASAATILFVSCTSAPTPDEPLGPIELRFWSNLTNEAQSSVMKAQVEECATEVGEDVTITFEAVPFGDMYSRMVTAFNAGEGPDIMNTLEGAVAFGEASENIAPVDDIIDEHGRDDFVQSFLHAVSKDDQTWGVPDWALHQEVWYRKDLFAKYDIDIPQSWPELLAAAETISENEADVDGFAIPLSSALVAPQTWYQFLYANGVYTFDPETCDYAFEDSLDEAVEATEFMLDLYAKTSPPESTTWSWTEFRTAFALGKLGMVLDFGAVVGLAREQNPQLLPSIGTFPLPAPTSSEDPGATLGGGYFYMIGKSEERREQVAKNVVACMMDPDLTAERANTRPVFALPATESAATSETYLSNEVVQEFDDEIQSIRENSLPSWYRYGMEAGLNPLAGQIEATTFIGDNLQAAALGQITAEEAVIAINEELKRLADVD